MRDRKSLENCLHPRFRLPKNEGTVVTILTRICSLANDERKKVMVKKKMEKRKKADKTRFQNGGKWRAGRKALRFAEKQRSLMLFNAWQIVSNILCEDIICISFGCNRSIASDAKKWPKQKI